MSPQEEEEIIRREVKRRGQRRITQLLCDIQQKLTRPSGWRPPLALIVHKAARLGIKLRMNLR